MGNLDLSMLKYITSSWEMKDYQHGNICYLVRYHTLAGRYLSFLQLFIDISSNN